eukprot:COSAG02_NODE_2109_length_9808_cov_4.669379_8_plen_158_part_00
MANKDLKRMLKNWYVRWKVRQLRTLDAHGVIQLAMPRDKFIEAIEEIFENYNEICRNAPKSPIRECFEKVGMDVYSRDMMAFNAWMQKLGEKSYYNNLTQAHVESAEGVDLETERYRLMPRLLVLELRAMYHCSHMILHSTNCDVGFLLLTPSVCKA